MKRILFSLLLIGAISFVACKNEKKADNAEPAKTDKPADAKPAEMASEKEHACSDKCKDGTHVYAHGEKGHTCTEECKSM
ncbi:MAG: hypothetical protein JNM88_17335 [Chitinophagaceae bacterium]|nr:hypothetical protein [Chitinophagaceae bacterium]